MTRTPNKGKSAAKQDAEVDGEESPAKKSEKRKGKIYEDSAQGKQKTLSVT